MALVALGGMMAGSGGAAEQVVVPEEHKRFLGVTKWYVTYTAVSEGNWSRSSGSGDGSSRGTVSRTLRGAFVTDVQAPDPWLMSALVKAFGGIKEVQWSVRPANPGGSPSRVHVIASDTKEDYIGPSTEGGDLVGDGGDRHSRSATAQGFASAQGAGALKIDLVNGTYSLALPWQMIRGSDRERSAARNGNSYVFGLDPRPEYKFSRSNTRHGVDELGGPVLDVLPPQPLPSGGLELSGSIRLAGKYNGSFEGERDRVATYVVWTCSPEPPADVELQVIPDQYTTWRPGGRYGVPVVEEGRPIPGNAFKVRLDLVDPRTGGPARVGVARIEAELKNVSTQLAVCINAPQDPISPADPDLKISPRYLWEPSDSGSRGALRPGRMPARLEIDCFDYGAWGDLEVRAILVDGREVKGRLFGQRGTETVRIPKRTGNSKIADGWKEDYRVTGSADHADDENEPVGDGTRGDGLTLYEEYRGFSALGKWWHGFPRTKELFVCSFVDFRLAQVGRLRLDRASGLDSHRLLPSCCDRPLVEPSAWSEMLARPRTSWRSGLATNCWRTWRYREEFPALGRRSAPFWGRAAICVNTGPGTLRRIGAWRATLRATVGSRKPVSAECSSWMKSPDRFRSERYRRSQILDRQFMGTGCSCTLVRAKASTVATPTA